MDDDRFTELMGLLVTFLSRTNYALETIASAQTAVAEIEIEHYKDYREEMEPLPKLARPEITLGPTQCQEPCCRRDA